MDSKFVYIIYNKYYSLNFSTYIISESIIDIDLID